MPVDVTNLFATYFGRNQGPRADDPNAHQPADYGLAASLDGETVALTLTFRTGAAYCCYEWGCHADMLNGKRWDRLREVFAASGLVLPERMRMRVAVVVEPDALFFDFARPIPGKRGSFALKPAGARLYEITVAEDDSPGRGYTPAGVS
jgi:hypothetical protein